MLGRKGKQNLITRPEDGLICRLGVKPPLKLILNLNIMHGTTEKPMCFLISGTGSFICIAYYKLGMIGVMFSHLYRGYIGVTGHVLHKKVILYKLSAVFNQLMGVFFLSILLKQTVLFTVLKVSHFQGSRRRCSKFPEGVTHFTGLTNRARARARGSG